jgi:hypothetical protein
MSVRVALIPIVFPSINKSPLSRHFEAGFAEAIDPQMAR